VALGFIDAVNRGDLDRLAELMTDDHTLVVLDEAPLVGKAANLDAWRGYVTSFPDYVIRPGTIHASGGTVVVDGTTTGSHLGLPDDQEMQLDVTWIAEAVDGKLSRWQVATAVPAAAQRRFGWSDMFVAPDDDPRADDGFQGERATLEGFLSDQRLTLELKCAGLDAEQLARRAVAPSTMSLLGLVRHLAEVERTWFRTRLAGQEVPRLFVSEADPDADFNGAVADPDVVAAAWAAWRDEVAFAQRYVADAPDFDHVGADGHGLRVVVVHMIEEYARHNGHADLLRERIDGRIGQ
jgi:ketosteroid isomerase-like protein